MNLSTEQKQTDRHRERLVVARERGGVGWTGSLWLIDANYYIWFKRINNEVPLHSTRNYMQSPGADHDRKYFKKIYVCVCVCVCVCV